MNIKKLIIMSTVLLGVCHCSFLKPMSQVEEERFPSFKESSIKERLTQAKEVLGEQRKRQRNALFTMSTRERSTGHPWYMSLHDIKNNSNVMEQVKIKYPLTSEVLYLDMPPKSSYRLDKTVSSDGGPVIITVGDNPKFELWVTSRGLVKLISESDRNRVLQRGSSNLAKGIIIDNGNVRIR